MPSWIGSPRTLTDPAEASALIEAHAQTDFELRRVGLAINRTEEDNQKLIEPVEPDLGGRGT